MERQYSASKHASSLGKKHDSFLNSLRRRMFMPSLFEIGPKNGHGPLFEQTGVPFTKRDLFRV